MSSRDQHLSDEEFEALLAAHSSASVLEPRQPRAQGKDRKSSAAYQEAARKLQRLRPEMPAPRTPFCPRPEIWKSIAAGSTAAGKSKGMVQHASHCDYCGALLREATELFAAGRPREGEAPLRKEVFSARKGSGKLAKKMAGRRPARYFWTATAAAAVIWSAFEIWRSKRSDIAHLPLRAYAEARTIQLRFPGAPYAPYWQEQDAGKLKTARWLEAEAAIARRATGTAVRPAVLQAQARMNLLEWNFESALAQLAWAAGREPNSTSLLIDLATAHYERAEAGGREQDFAVSIELLSRALAARRDPAALFNRAIVYERMGLKEDAIEDWKQYLRADPQGPWNAEAQQRLYELLKRVRGDGSADGDTKS